MSSTKLLLDDKPLIPRQVRLQIRTATTIAVIALFMASVLGVTYTGTTVSLYNRVSASEKDVSNLKTANSATNAQLLEAFMQLSHVMGANVTVTDTGTFDWVFRSIPGNTLTTVSGGTFRVKNVRLSDVIDFTVLSIDPLPGGPFAFSDEGYQFTLTSFNPPVLPALPITFTNSNNGAYVLPFSQANVNRMQLAAGCFESATEDDGAVQTRNGLLYSAQDFLDSSTYYLTGYFLFNVNGNSFQLSSPWELIFPIA
jgi:hypothetical protein